MNTLVLEKHQMRSPYQSHLAFLEKKEGEKKRTQPKSWPYISQLSFPQKTPTKNRTMTDELPECKRTLWIQRLVISGLSVIHSQTLSSTNESSGTRSWPWTLSTWPGCRSTTSSSSWASRGDSSSPAGGPSPPPEDILLGRRRRTDRKLLSDNRLYPLLSKMSNK